jgi:hypothetical protein
MTAFVIEAWMTSRTAPSSAFTDELLLSVALQTDP